MSEPRTSGPDKPTRHKTTTGSRRPHVATPPAAEGELVAARFIARPNRFIVRAELADTTVVDAHLADPGRLIELLLPGAALRLRQAAPSSKRRTAYSVALVRAAAPSRAWVSVETTRANALAEGLLSTGAVQGLEDDWELRREVRHGSSRFDFLLQRGTQRLWVEVKSVTLVEDGLGLFPDAPTKRGRRHVQELADLVRNGESAMVLFVAQRGDVLAVAPHALIDPDFADALSDAERAGVELRAAGFQFDASGRVTGCASIPVLTPQG